ncbi:MAG: anthranilate synthase component I family protein [Verrucomicrobiales bacterium]
MTQVLQEVNAHHTPESLVDLLGGEKFVILLRTALFDSTSARYSFVACNPFLRFSSFGSRCVVQSEQETSEQFGDPWQLLNVLMARYEMLDEIDMPFPLGGCFGFWGYDLKNFVEPRLARKVEVDLEIPDCAVGFYDSLVVFDHHLGKAWIVSTGISEDGSRSDDRAEEMFQFWNNVLHAPAHAPEGAWHDSEVAPPESNFDQKSFCAAVDKAQRYIHFGHIYQVNLSQRFQTTQPCSAWQFHKLLSAISPTPFSAFISWDAFQLCSVSPEEFIRISGSQIETKPIKGTRPRDPDPTRDTQLAFELQTSPKENAELVMITDLLRNDLGRFCEYGSIHVPQLARLERFSHVQHLVSTVQGRLKAGVTHFEAFASCFPGGSITGAPKFRAMEIIEELEPVSRGPYTGALGYLGFNKETQLSIIIRTAICAEAKIYFNAGAGIVADSSPEAEYEETFAKARPFFRALEMANEARANLRRPGVQRKEDDA